jgi:4-hydroxy-L-threonine phosphate dehydrogenase PdxA
MKDTKPVLGITMGDPFGIGPEIAVKALSKPYQITIRSRLSFGLNVHTPA